MRLIETMWFWKGSIHVLNKAAMEKYVGFQAPKKTLHFIDKSNVTYL